MKLINELDIGDAAKKLYGIKGEYPENKIAKRCVEYKELENYAKNYGEPPVG